MKKYTKKAFTLVELIVVITILAILATVAFISFGGQTGKAKNSKVVSDVSNIASKVNLLSLEDTTVVKNTLSGSITDNRVSGTGAGVALDPANNYDAGSINFYTLKEKAENFQDTTDKENPKGYIYAYVAQNDINVFNVGGQVKDEAGAYSAVIKGTYYKAASDDVDSLISSTANDTPVKDGDAAQLY